MAANPKERVFDILGIAPTNEFKQAKKAYLRKAKLHHPDKNPKDEEKFKELQQAWVEVDDQDKLNEYYQHHQARNLNELISKRQSEPHDEPSDHFESDDKSVVRFIPKTEVFFIVPFLPNREDKRRHKNSIFLLDQHQDDKYLDIQELAELITRILSASNHQVGVTFDEAVIIESLHKHLTPKLIVKISVPIACVSEERVSEKDMYDPSVLNVKSGDYFWLDKDTVVNVHDIISIETVSRYMNSLAFISHLQGKQIEDYWPLNYIYYPSQHSSIEHQEEQPALSSPGNENAVVLESQGHKLPEFKFVDFKEKLIQRMNSSFRVGFFGQSSFCKKILEHKVTDLESIQAHADNPKNRAGLVREILYKNFDVSQKPKQNQLAITHNP